jgi:hypothetical protein
MKTPINSETKKLARKLYRQGHTIHTAGNYSVEVLRELDAMQWRSLTRSMNKSQKRD